MPTRHEDFVFERQRKGWSGAKKLALMSGDWTLVRILAQRSGHHPE